jgi:small subunit ribosomal protein S21
MIIVKVQKGKLEKALRTYKKKVNSSGLSNELRERKQYTKKSVTRREQLQKAKYRQKNSKS